MQKVRGLISAVVIGAPLDVFLMFWMHATREFAALIGAVIGAAIFAVVATRSDAHDEAADLAWQAAAPDLPPVSDRIVLDRTQATMPAPGKTRVVARSSTDGSGKSNGASIAGAEPR